MKPSDFYFNIMRPDIVFSGDSEVYVVISGKDIFDDEGCLDGENDADDVAPSYLDNLTENCFEINSDETVANIRQDLINRGFIENTNMLG